MENRNFSPVRINQSQQQEIVDIFRLMPEDKRLAMKMTLDILGWDIVTHPSRGVRLERQR